MNPSTMSSKLFRDMHKHKFTPDQVAELLMSCTAAMLTTFTRGDMEAALRGVDAFASDVKERVTIAAAIHANRGPVQ